MANTWPYNTARWQRVRKRQLLREPLCRACQVEGVINAASEVNHIERVSVGGAVFDPANLQSLCQRHHSVKTQYEMHGKSFDAYLRRGFWQPPTNAAGARAGLIHPDVYA